MEFFLHQQRRKKSDEDGTNGLLCIVYTRKKITKCFSKIKIKNKSKYPKHSFLISLCSSWFSKARNTIFTCARKHMFPGCLCFEFIKIFQENFIAFNKIRGVYSAVHQLWSNTHQLRKISVIITCLIIFCTSNITSLQIYKTNSPFCSYTFDAIKIHPPNKHQFFRLICSSSLIDFEKVFKQPLIASKESSLVGISRIKILGSSLFHQWPLSLHSYFYELKKLLKVLKIYQFFFFTLD